MPPLSILSDTSKKYLYKEILTIALPLVLSSTGFTLMQFMTTIFLSWYSPEAVAASSSAGLANYLLITILLGPALFVSTLVAHYSGSGNNDKARKTAWQGTYFSVAAGLLIALLSFLGAPIFGLANHKELLFENEVIYFRYLCFGAIFHYLTTTFSGYYSGIGKTRVILIIQSGGFVINAIIDYLLIFGKMGLPSLGIKGAGISAVVSQCFTAALFITLFIWEKRKLPLFPRNEARFDLGIIKKLLYYGFPNGWRISTEMIAWTLFTIMIGRIGTIELAATTIAFRINGFAFFPILGLSQAIGVITGQARGSNNNKLVIKATKQGLVLTQLWMVFMALCFFFIPGPILQLFQDPFHHAESSDLLKMGVVLLRFVAIYSLLDGFNMLFLSLLQYLGDTLWTMITSLVLNATFISILLLADHYHASMYTQWTFATAFLIVQVFFWLGRFLHGKWKTIHVIDEMHIA